MNSKLAASIVMISSLLGVCGPVSAHHGNSAYDEEHQIAVTGTVTEFVWSNPHCQIYVDVKDEHGKVVNWAIESQSPGILRRNNWTQDFPQAGRPDYSDACPRQERSGGRVFRK